MREILFKGKRVDNGEWVEGFYTGVYDVPCIDYLKNGIPHTVCVLPETVSQFTGLTDKNGVKIFEGDILDISYFLTKYKGAVMFGKNKPCDMTKEYECGNQGFYVETKAPKPNTFRKDLYFYISHSNVIGNIFDNPELLESGVE